MIKGSKTSLERLTQWDHPYYCSESNYYSNDAAEQYETATDFLNDFEDADIDMNLIFRWDISPRGEIGAETGRYYAKIFIIKQRKGIFMPIHISHINEKEAQRLEVYLKKHFDNLMEIWAPFGRKEESDKC